MSKKSEGDTPKKDESVENLEEGMEDVWWGCCSLEKHETLSGDVGAFNIFHTKQEAVSIACQFLGTRMVKSVAVFPMKWRHGPIQFITSEDINLDPSEGEEDESDDEQADVSSQDKYGPS